MAIIKELHPATHKCQIVNADADADEISFSFFDSFVKKKQRLKKEKYKTEFSIVNYPFFCFVWSFNEGVAKVIKVMLQSARNKNSGSMSKTVEQKLK